MKTYATKSIKEILKPTLTILHKKFDNKLMFLKSVWDDIAPKWALEAKPFSIKHNAVFFKAKNNALILQFKEKEILKITNLILGDTINKIKILAD